MSGSDKGSSKADTLIKVVLVFFISLLSFSVGTFVGHQFSKSEQRRMALEGEFKPERGVASAGDHHDEKISDKEVESLTEEFVNKEKGHETAEHSEENAEEHGEAEHKAADAGGYKSYPRGKKPEAAHDDEPATAAHAPTKADAHGKEAHGKSAPMAAADKVANDKAPTDGMKEARKPASTLPSVASSAVGKFTVQVASYADESEAKNHAANLKGKGWTAFYVPATVQGRTWYRVSVGIYETNKAAADAREQFMKDTSSKSALVQKIVQ